MMKKIKDDFEEDYHINFYDNTNIKELTKQDFDIKNKKFKNKKFSKINGIIIFYSNFCVSCKKIYNILVNISEMYDNKFNFYAVNCNNIKEGNDYLIRDFKITEYPMFKLIKNNKIKDIDLSKFSIEKLIYLIDTNK